MPKPRIVRFAESWTPDPTDPFGEDERPLIRHLLDNAITFKSRLVQLADLVAGAVRRSVAGEARPLREIEDKMITLQCWPPR
jgi:hypothetical protein